MIRAFPSRSIMMFPGLRSRWTIPSRWASAKPRQTCLARKRALETVKPAGLADQALQVLTRNVLHGDEMDAPVLGQVVHPADVLVDDPAGDLQLVAEALERPPVGGDLGADQLEGDLVLDQLVDRPVNLAHPAPAQLLDDQVPAGEDRAGGESRSRLIDRRRRVFARVGHRRTAVRAEPGRVGIGGTALRSNIGSSSCVTWRIHPEYQPHRRVSIPVR